MRASMVPSRFPTGRLAWATVAVLLCVCDLGCSRLRSFRSVGIAPALLGGAPKPASAGPDLYASRARESRAAEGGQPTIVADLAQPAGTIIRSTAAPLGAPAPAFSERLNIVKPINIDISPVDSMPPLDLSKIEKDLKPQVAASAIEETKRLIGLARGQLDSIQTYQVNMNRQERVGNNLLPSEDVVLSIRREPRAVRLEWPNGPHHGREVLYNAGADGGLMHIRTPNALVPRMTLPPDSPLVARSSRHPITEAGFDPVLRILDDSLAAQTSGAVHDVFTVNGPEPLPGTGRQARKVVRRTADGETWNVWFDEETHLPALVEAHDKAGDLLERYLFTDAKLNPDDLNLANAFDPDSRWGASRGLLGRMARGAAEAENPAQQAANSTTR